MKQEDTSIPDKIYATEGIEFVRKDRVLDLVKLAYGKVSMNPFDCSEAFEELIENIESL
jgi:hypothetical protein